MKTLADGVHVVDGNQRFLGLEVGARMTVLETDGGLLVHSPVDVSPDSLSELGTPRWVLAPNLFHHLYVGPWIQAGAEAWGAPGLQKKRPDLAFHGGIDSSTQPFGSDIEIVAMSCFPLLNEVVVLHRPSRTLVVTDLVFNIAPTAPLLTRAVMRCACGYPGCKTTLLERALMRRAQARTDLSTLLALDFDRLIMSHGQVIETGGKSALAQAFSWLRLQSQLT